MGQDSSIGEEAGSPAEHLPDCDDYAFSGAGFHPDCERICICRQVRRIEQRVFQEQILGRQYEMVLAYQRGLDAAREAVRHALGPMDSTDPGQRDAALAAIDALRGES